MTDVQPQKSPDEVEASLASAIKTIAEDQDSGSERVRPQLEALTDAFLNLLGEDITQEALLDARQKFFEIGGQYEMSSGAISSYYTKVLEQAFLRAHAEKIEAVETGDVASVVQLTSGAVQRTGEAALDAMDHRM